MAAALNHGKQGCWKDERQKKILLAPTKKVVHGTSKFWCIYDFSNRWGGESRWCIDNMVPHK